MTDLVPVRLCIFSTMRTRDISKVPGVLLKEVMDFGEAFEHVILLHFHRRYSVRKLTNNVMVVTIPYIDPKTPARFAVSIFVSYLVSIPVIATLALKYKINLFRADDPLMTGLPCILVSKILRIRCIVSMYGDVEEVIMYKIGKESRVNSFVLPIVRKVVEFVVSNSVACVVVSRRLKDIAKHFGSKKVWLTYPNVDLSIFKARGNTEHRAKFTVLFVGRLEPEKGPLNVLEVAGMLTNVEFKVAGYGSLQGEMEKRIRGKQLKNVKMLGIVNHYDLPDLYRSSDVLLLPSFSEGIPIVMLEAMASELPVIVSKVGAVGEILKDENGGFTVTPGDIQGIVSKIVILLNDEKLRITLGRKGRINVSSKFNNFILAQMDLYKSLITN